MPKFEYTALDDGGRAVCGELEAATTELASAQVRSMGLFPTRMTADDLGAVAAPRARGLQLGRVIDLHGLAEFTRQLGTLLQAGLPLLRGLQLLARQERRAPFRSLLERLAEELVGGRSLSAALARHPREFSELYRGMVQAGEASGRLDLAMLELARFLEKADRVRRRIRAALYYPVAVLAVTVLILVGLMLFVVPQFRTIFQEQLKGAEMPALTQVVLGASDFVAAHWAVLALAGAATWAGWAGLRSFAGARRFCDRVVLHVPALGPLCRRTAMARLSRTLGTLLANGVPILDALQLARATAGNAAYASAVDRVIGRVRSGGAVAAALAAEPLVPEMLVSLVAVGEETGALAAMLGRVAEVYEEEVDTAVGGLTALLEPLLIVFLALTVGTIVLALFLPIVRIIQTMS